MSSMLILCQNMAVALPYVLSMHSAELAAQLYADELHVNSNTAPTHPPSSLEDYQKAARADHPVQKRLCTLM